MNPESDSLRKLREHFAEAPRGAVGENCPDAERIWAAVQGELAPEETGAVIDHTVVCSECAEAWRLAREVSREDLPVTSVADTGSGTSRSPWTRSFLPLAAAAALLLVLLIPVFVLRDGLPPDVTRGPQSDITSLVPENAVLPRDEFILRWSPGPEGSTYRLTVSAEDLTPILERRDLSESAFVVPAPAFAQLPSMAVIHWQVERTSPDGVVTRSPTFITRVK